MSKFLSAEILESAINALKKTKAKSSMLDFLIIKRTMAIKGQSKVAITQGEPAYIQAAEELAAVDPSKSYKVSTTKPFYNIFAQEERKGGFRSAKFISNGTNTTIG